MLQGKRILLIITGSIAAYKSLELIRLLTKAGAEVEGVLTRGGAQFITPLSVATLTGKKGHTEMWDEDARLMNHIELSRRCDLIVVAPATADIVAKLANGLGDDLASSVLLAKNKPVLLAPSMNVEMWDNPAFQRNLAQAVADGAQLVPPQTDTLVCGETGIGKMAEPADILAAIERHFAATQSLVGQKAVVTAGATIERIDGVRYISNFSSGKQGIAIAKALARAGAEVSLVLGNASAPLPNDPRIQILRVESAEQMKAAVHQRLPATIFVACAAVCDFKVANAPAGKIKKENGLNLAFEENPDIARSVGTLPPGQRPKVVVGFAAETDNLIANAQKKLASKGCDLVVANDVSGGGVFGKDENAASFVTKTGVEPLSSQTKDALAERIASWIAQAI